MTTSKENLLKYFSDEFFVEDIIEMLKNNETTPYTKEIIEEILTGASAKDLLEKLFIKSKAEKFSVDIPLSDCFFLVSELTEITIPQRDFALDMSIHLSEESDSRDPSFVAENAYKNI
jgi:hypothetical protein